MAKFEKFFLSKIYDRAGSAEELPWHQSEPPEMLQEVVAARGAAGRALDIGCGAGYNSVFLAQQGYDVTAVDFTPKAVEWTRQAARDAGVELRAEQADILQWSCDEPFDLVLDAACLHTLSRGECEAYKQQLLRFLAANSAYVLVHFDKRHALDWRPVGPRRVRPEVLRSWFAPQLQYQRHITKIHSAFLPIGPTVAVSEYHFLRG